MDKAIITLVDQYWDNPVWFAEDMLGFYPDPWQKKVLMDLAQHPKVSVRSGQGVGKTGLESIAIIWYLCTRPFPKIIATAPTRQQLYDVLWAEIAKWLAKSKVESLLKWTKTKIYMNGCEARWWATARTAVRPENMQGFHEDYMLFVIDEASGVADPIMEAILGTLTGYENKLLLCGNPTKTSGVFYDSHNRDRSMYKTHKVSSMQSPRTSDANIQMLIEKYGADSNVVRVRVDAEFPKQDADTFIPIELVEDSCIVEFDELPNDEVKLIRLGIDIARFGDDETVIYPNIENEIIEKDIKIRLGQDTMKTTGDILNLARQYHKIYPNAHIFAITDDTGVGGGVTDRLNEILVNREIKGLDTYFHVVPIVASAGVEHENYDDITTLLWGTVRELMQDRQLKIPNCNRLVGQLTVRKYYLTSRGKLKLESKKMMKARGIDSPDRADALALACVPVDLKLLQDNREGGKRR